MRHYLLMFGVFLLLFNTMIANPRVNYKAKDVLLKRGTTVSLILAETVNSQDATIQEGKVIDLEVRIDVVKNGKTVIATGAFAEGYIYQIQKRRSFGRGASLVIRAKNVQTVDGQRAILYGGELTAKVQRGRKGLAFGLLIGLGLIGVLITALSGSFWGIFLGLAFGLALGASTKGSRVEIAMQESLTATIAEDILITVIE